MNLRLDVKQTQNLVLTPQLQQAIKLLQLSNQDLLGTVQNEVAENPFLRLADGIEAGTGSIPARGGAAANGDAANGGAANGGATDTAWPPANLAAAPAASPAAGAGSEREVGEWDQPQAAPASDARLGLRHTQGRNEAEAPRSYEDYLSRPANLRDHLRAQIGATSIDPAVRRLALTLVDWVEEDGYLREDDSALAQALGAAIETVRQARAALQRCEPTGVGARDLAECLGLQLAEKDRLDPAMRALLANLPRLARADWAALERLCGVDREDLEEMVGEIKALDPRPGSGFAPDDPGIVVPDVHVRRARGSWRVELNQAAQPRLVVDGEFYADLSRTPLPTKDREYMAERFQSANWLTRALQQRSRTILRVSKAIFERQLRFLEEGPQALRPLVLRDIAAATNLHESTVSRATADKYVETPHGTYALKYFFSTAIHATEGGEDHSAEAIRQRIRKMISEETPTAVLSDDQIMARLRQEGIAIARRTVAKYRESLGLPSSVDRRRAKALVRS